MSCSKSKRIVAVNKNVVQLEFWVSLSCLLPSVVLTPGTVSLL